ncbi:MAG: YkgJ family cysteine cluster protein [Gammaproteobacteria bacterium]|nr:YkgJ family cysteine cluster protein [Gammaproteobacteria bacterium]
MTERFSHPTAEQQYPWLGTLLDTYHAINEVITAHIAKLQRSGMTLACHRGCHACCLNNPDVPFTELELKGILWYVSEVLDGELKQRLKQQLRDYRSTTACPFLVDRACSIYPVRPFICRQFHVQTRPCDIGEDIFGGRLQDIVPPPTDVEPIAMRLIEYSRRNQRIEKTQAPETTSIFDAVSQIQAPCSVREYDWIRVADDMDRFDGQGAMGSSSAR